MRITQGQSILSCRRLFILLVLAATLFINVGCGDRACIEGDCTYVPPAGNQPPTTSSPSVNPPTSDGETADRPEEPSSEGGDRDWLSVSGNTVIDHRGRPVWITGANWFGFNTSERVFHGLWAAHLETFVQEVAERGINLIRVPISTELLKEWKSGVFSKIVINDFINPDLKSATSLDIFDRFLEVADQNGIKVMLDVHSAEANNAGHVAPLWYTDRFTEDDFIETWEWVAQRYKDNDTVIAYDLQNEPHGKGWEAGDVARWDNSDHPNNWKRVAQTTAQRILAINPNALILIEGNESYPTDGKTWNSSDRNDYFNTWWGGNLRGVRDYPIEVGLHQKQIMYSPHDYGPSVWPQSWFYEGFNRQTLIEDVWYENWLYIHDEGIAPLLIGEWGGHLDGDENEHWMTELRSMMVDKKIHHTFWCLNPNSGDTGGLLLHDWTTWDEEKYAFFAKSLWQISGRFVGLSQNTSLGKDGLSVNQYYDLGGEAPIDPETNR